MVINHYLSIADSDFPEWFMRIELLTNQLAVYVNS